MNVRLVCVCVFVFRACQHDVDLSVLAPVFAIVDPHAHVFSVVAFFPALCFGWQHSNMILQCYTRFEIMPVDFQASVVSWFVLLKFN